MDYTITIAGEVIDLNCGGIAQVRRLQKLSKFLKLYALQALKNTDSTQLVTGDSQATITLILEFISTIDEDGYFLLGSMVSGKDIEWVQENFDIEWVVDGVTIMLKLPLFQKLMQSFTGGRG